MELETTNRLFLELSQFVTAKTARELELEENLGKVLTALAELVDGLKVTTWSSSQTTAHFARAQRDAEVLLASFMQAAMSAQGEK